MSFLIYGANGYTGRLIAEECVKRGLKPILAGRNRVEIERFGSTLSLPTRVFGCADTKEIAPHLDGIALVLHCAGPFSSTSQPMFEACLQAHAHYLDITGEIPVFERIHKQNERIRQAGIVAMPGVGFDVVPSDCLAAKLKRELPDATKLEIALRISAFASPGTAKTMVEGLYAGTLARRGGKIQRFPAGSFCRKIRFTANEPEQPAVAISWGDVSTAWYSTGILEITTYLGTSRGVILGMKSSRVLAPVLASKKVQGFLKSLVDRSIHGPDGATRAVSPYFLWGRVENASGASREHWLKTPNGYSLTVDAALAAVERVLSGGLAPGAWTPSKAFGPDFVDSLPGVELT